MPIRQVYRMPKAGSINDLKLQTEETGLPETGEVCVQVKAIGLNFADIFAMQGLYSATPAGSFIPGLEFSGEVSAIGPEVKGWKPGDKVMGVTRFGGYVSQININERYIIPLPESWSFEEGAGGVFTHADIYQITCLHPYNPLKGIVKKQNETTLPPKGDLKNPVLTPVLYCRLSTFKFKPALSFHFFSNPSGPGKIPG